MVKPGSKLDMPCLFSGPPSFGVPERASKDPCKQEARFNSREMDICLKSTRSVLLVSRAKAASEKSPLAYTQVPDERNALEVALFPSHSMGS